MTGDREAGNAAVELAPVALVLIMFLAVAVTAGRVIIARNAIADAAREATLGILSPHRGGSRGPVRLLAIGQPPPPANASGLSSSVTGERENC